MKSVEKKARNIDISKNEQMNTRKYIPHDNHKLIPHLQGASIVDKQTNKGCRRK